VPAEADRSSGELPPAPQVIRFVDRLRNFPDLAGTASLRTKKFVSYTPRPS
jgi:hypothetical protein